MCHHLGLACIHTVRKREIASEFLTLARDTSRIDPPPHSTSSCLAHTPHGSTHNHLPNTPQPHHTLASPPAVVHHSNPTSHHQTAYSTPPPNRTTPHSPHHLINHQKYCIATPYTLLSPQNQPGFPCPSQAQTVHQPHTFMHTHQLYRNSCSILLRRTHHRSVSHSAAYGTARSTAVLTWVNPQRLTRVWRAPGLYSPLPRTESSSRYAHSTCLFLCRTLVSACLHAAGRNAESICFHRLLWSTMLLKSSACHP